MIQRHASFEHRLLGDVPPGDLFKLGAYKDLRGDSVPVRKLDGSVQRVARSEIEHLLSQELRRLKKWQTQPPAVTDMRRVSTQLHDAARALKTDDPEWNVRLVAIESTTGGENLVLTYGELNALADFYGNVEELKAADATKRRNVVQSVRQQSYEKLLSIYKEVVGTGPEAAAGIDALEKPEFSGAFNITGIAGELGQMTKDKKGAAGETTAYKATLGRNACHFAPESWHSWESNHHKALALARQAHATPMVKGRLLNEALVYNGFGDHYLQDSYAAGHLINKTQIMQMYVRYQDDNQPTNKGYASTPTWRAFQGMAYTQRGMTDATQYNKAGVGRRVVGGKTVSTARNPQAVENTQSSDVTWQDRFQMLGLTIPAGARAGTPGFKLLLWMQRQRGGLLRSRYDVAFPYVDIFKARTDIGLAGPEISVAIRSLLDGNIIFRTGTIVGESRHDAGARLETGATKVDDGKFTLRKEWVVSVGGGHDAAFNVAAAGAEAGDPVAYEKMMQATIYKDYATFMADAYLQKATNALHDEFCKTGLKVATAVGQPVFKIYGDDAMLNSESSKGLKHSAETANLSRDSILAVAETGVEPAGKSTRDILDRLPSAVSPPGGRGVLISLADWHNAGSLEAWARENVFKAMSAAINAAVGGSGSLGKLTADQDVHGAEAF